MYEEFIYDTFINFGTFSINTRPNIVEDISKRLKKNVNHILMVG